LVQHLIKHLITALSKEGEIEDAKGLMRLMDSHGLHADIYTYSVLMSGYTRKEAWLVKLMLCFGKQRRFIENKAVLLITLLFMVTARWRSFLRV
jgi:pentatricopeptide repeat protein